MSQQYKKRHAELQRKRARILAGIGVGAAVTAVCPPAGILLGIAGFLGSARRVAQNPNDDEAMTNLFLGYGGLVNGGGTSKHGSR